jgi:tetratricopeptide (TPR) repeat protein/GTPase SAR1 family protein
MSIEKSLIQKSYYQTLLGTEVEEHPLHRLGELFVAEQKKEIGDLADIRFAQGELYYHIKDYEAAIFKWEHVQNELEPWAQKNRADAFYQLGLLSNAVELYKSIESDHPILNVEVGLQLFSIYLEQDRMEAASKVIKKVVLIHPDYENVTRLARTFYENQGDWESAVELAIAECLRTENPIWFDTLVSYIQNGFTKGLMPETYLQVLMRLYEVDEKRFEQLATSIWDSFHAEPSYFKWLIEFNEFLSKLEIEDTRKWQELSNRYKGTITELISGNYLIKQIQGILPSLLTNYLTVAASSHNLFAATTILAWNDQYPASISPESIEKAEKVLTVARQHESSQSEVIALFEEMEAWANQHELSMDYTYKWSAGELVDDQTANMLVVGMAGNGKSSFINSLLGEQLVGEAPTSTVVRFKHHHEIEIDEITSNGRTEVVGLEELYEKTTVGRQALTNTSLVDVRIPNTFLQKNQLAILDTPGINGHYNQGEEVLKWVPFVDRILFVLNANQPFLELERETVLRIRAMYPDMPIHFVLNKMDIIYNEKEAIQLVDETEARIKFYFPNGKLFAFSSKFDRMSQINDFSNFLELITNVEEVEENRTEKLLHVIYQSIHHLLNERVQVEHELEAKIQEDEEMIGKLKGALNQLDDLQKDQVGKVRNAFAEQKRRVKSEITENIPTILRNCASLISEDSDFRNIHQELNEEMNLRIQEYLQRELLPTYFRYLEEWMQLSQEELTQSQLFMDEMRDGFNALFSEERLQLACDFQIMEDWKRDINRLTSSIQLEQMNILLRFNPSQFLLKSAGKLFGAIPQNKAILYNRYTAYIENEDYHDVAESIAKQFLQPFELFERALDRDVKLFFGNCYEGLDTVVAEIQADIHHHKQLLEEMKEKPDVYLDPIKLFELRLRQLQWQLMIGVKKQTI